MELVIIESPFAGRTNEETEENVTYARACMADCLRRGEAPYASHLLYTQPGVLDDKVPAERKKGIDAGLAFKALICRTVVYVDRGISPGMQLGIDRAVELGHGVEYRRLRAKDGTYPDSDATWEKRRCPFTVNEYYYAHPAPVVDDVTPRTVGVGSRNIHLTELAERLRGRGAEHADIFTTLKETNAGFPEPLLDAEVATIARGVVMSKRVPYARGVS